jgi:hypothetical protein
MPQLLSRKTVTARVPHPCETCGTTAIAAGERYVREALVYDGRAYTWVQCLPCSGLSSAVWEWAGHPDEGIGMDDYHEWATESLNDPEMGDRAAAYLLRDEANRRRRS